MLSLLCGTGNNISVRGDMGRRVIRARLVSRVESPQSRSGFKYPDLEGHVRANRVDLVCGALGLLASYLKSGSPRVALPAFGSFDEWSGIVRSAIVWAGFPDPVETAKAIQEGEDTDRAELASLIALFKYVTRPGEEITAREFAHRAKGDPIGYPEAAERFAETGIQAKPNELVSKLGYALRRAKERPCRGLQLVVREGRAHERYWSLVALSNQVNSVAPGEEGEL
jgi:hypothetical protein